MKLKTPYLLFATVLLFQACKTGSSKESASQKEQMNTEVSSIQPIKGLEVPVTFYEIIANAPSTIKLPNGGSVDIPQDAFQDKNGKTIKGKVNLEWTEFHSLTDVLLSGIPMKYDSAGVENNFVSGGMFTINANQKGEKLEIRQGKEIAVNLVSTDDTPCYNFYALDEETGKWDYKKTETGKKIQPEKTSEKKEEDTPSKIAPILIDCEVEYEQYQELKNQDIIAWEVTEELNLDEKNRIKNHVSRLTLEKDELGYFLDFKRKEINSKIYVKPFLMADAQRNTKTLKAEMKSDYAAIRTYYQDVSNGKVERSISISNFGTYNWDCIHNRRDIQTVFARFDYGKKVKNPELVSLFYLCMEDNLIIKCSPEEDKKFFFSPNKKNALIAITPDNQLYVMENSGFKELAKQKGRANYTLHLRPSGMMAQKGGDVADIAKKLFQ